MEALYKINSSEWLAFQHVKQYCKVILYFSGKQDEKDLISLIFILNAENLILKRGPDMINGVLMDVFLLIV